MAQVKTFYIKDNMQKNILQAEFMTKAILARLNLMRTDQVFQETF